MISSDVLSKICNTLKCSIDEVVDLVPDDNEEFIVENNPNKLKVISLFFRSRRHGFRVSKCRF